MTMTAYELINYSSHDVRKSPDLMAIYIQLYSDYFGNAPNCAACTFKTDWKKFASKVNTGTKPTLKTVTMSESTFKFKGPRQILTYRIGSRPFRSYSNNMTEDFAVNFLTQGTPEQLEARKKMFTKLPDLPETPEDGKPIDKMNRKELDALAESKGLNPADYSNKKEVISALEALN